MKPNDPIDFDSPLGISKKEWTKVLGVNLALLLLVYAIALVCTLCGSDLFLLATENEQLQTIEDVMRSWSVYPLVQIGFATIEETIMLCFIKLRKPKWWWVLSYFAIRVINNVLWFNLYGSVPTWSFMMINAVFTMAFVLAYRKQMIKPLIRFAIALIVTLALNGMITLFRTKILEINHLYTNVQFFYLSLEYDIALSLALGLIALAVPWNKTKGESQPWETTVDAGGSSPTMKKWSPKNSKIAKTNLSPKHKKRLRLLKLKVIAIQTVALIVITALPLFAGRPVEFALVYASFCLTRLILGFSHSLHFKSEFVCITAGAFCFWALTFLTPSVEVLIILSLCYGAGLALGFRLYWELHDLMMYRKASKTDRYAMLYVVFKGNVSPKHINGVMRAKGYSDKIEIEMVQMYMRKDKVEYIASYFTFAKITVEKKLTEIASDLYNRR